MFSTTRGQYHVIYLRQLCNNTLTDYNHDETQENEREISNNLTVISKVGTIRNI